MTTRIIVRRDASEIYQHLETTWARKAGSDLTLIWDRRTGDRRRHDAPMPVKRRQGERRDTTRNTERRRQSERRQSERRRRAPDTWGTLSFLVVQDEGGPL